LVIIKSLTSTTSPPWSLSVGRQWVHWSQPWYKKIILKGNYLFIKCEDSMTQDLLPKLVNICNFINQQLNPVPPSSIATKACRSLLQL
ncbi:uncharacterized protein BDR25DRAFT_371068, partial [Lindgomyces ingoldianus]